jgi:1-pyrroline-5-carboxylate dehydrogenase
VGETGGKNFHMVHPSADVDQVVYQTIRGAFEYSGQKCSATSRMYVPESLWPEVEKKMKAAVAGLKVGQSDDFTVFTSAVIDKNSFDKIRGYIEYARADTANCRIIAGGTYSDEKGYFVQPTIIHSLNPKSKTMTEEIFGPVLTVYVYPDEEYEHTLALVNDTGPYSLTGSIFSRDRYAIDLAHKILRDASGNFYVNDKSTGAVVGQQPFGGARASGTNDKAGFGQNLLRWTSARTVKETFVPIPGVGYPHMKA